MYADDTVLLVDGVNWNATQAHADAALAVVTHWLSRNLLRLNADKTLCFTFSPNSASHPPPSFTVVAHAFLYKIHHTHRRNPSAIVCK